MHKFISRLFFSHSQVIKIRFLSFFPEVFLQFDFIVLLDALPLIILS